MEENKRSTGRGCLKALGIGCLTVVVAVLAAVILVWINWDKIQESGWYHSMTGMAESAKAEMGNMMMLQKSLMTEYPAEGVSVQARGQSG